MESSGNVQVGKKVRPGRSSSPSASWGYYIFGGSTQLLGLLPLSIGALMVEILPDAVMLHLKLSVRITL